MNSSSLPGRGAPKVPLTPAFRKLGLLKYDCPNPDCSSWFVTFDPLDVLCKDCQRTMVDTEIL